MKKQRMRKYEQRGKAFLRNQSETDRAENDVLYEEMKKKMEKEWREGQSWNVSK